MGRSETLEQYLSRLEGHFPDPALWQQVRARVTGRYGYDARRLIWAYLEAHEAKHGQRLTSGHFTAALPPGRGAQEGFDWVVTAYLNGAHESAG